MRPRITPSLALTSALLAVLTAAFTGALTPGLAAADVVGPIDPAVMCPLGARIEVNHCGTECARLRCETDADCRGGRVCRPVPLCAEDAMYCGRGGPTYERILGACPGGACAAGDCRTLMACVPGTPATDAGGADLDSGPPSLDSGPGGTDSGPGGTDSGSVDSGAPPADAGGASVVTYGCGCRVGAAAPTGGLAFLAVGLGLALLRRRQTRSYERTAR